MFVPSKSALERRSKTYRYIYFLFSSLKPKSLSAWERDGEPNPFVRSEPDRRATYRQEIIDIFEDKLGSR